MVAFLIREGAKTGLGMTARAVGKTGEALGVVAVVGETVVTKGAVALAPGGVKDVLAVANPFTTEVVVPVSRQPWANANFVATAVI